MHEPQVSALHNREHHCIIRVHHIETRTVRKMCFIAGQVASGQLDCFHVTTEFEKAPKARRWTAIQLRGRRLAVGESAKVT